MNKRVVILWVCFFVWAVSLMAQDVPGGVVAAFKKGNSQELNGYLSDKVELILESRSINVDNQAAEKKMASCVIRKIVNIKREYENSRSTD